MSDATPLPFYPVIDREQEITGLRRQLDDLNRRVIEAQRKPWLTLGGFLWLSDWTPTGQPC
jgi:hypothetical protein